MTTEKSKKLLYYGSLTLLFVVILGYGISRSRDLLFGIKLSVENMSDGMVTTEEILPLRGVARHAVGITINGQDVPISQEGLWADTIALMPGYNVITIAATDKFKRTITQQYKLNYKQPSEIIPNP